MPEGIELQAAALCAMPHAPALGDEACALWRAALGKRKEGEREEGDGLPAATWNVPAAPIHTHMPPANAPGTPGTPPLDAPIDTALTLHRQLTLASLPQAECTWHLSLPDAWEVLALRHTATPDTAATPAGALPAWTLALSPGHTRQLQDSTSLTAHLDRLQVRLSRLDARVVLANREPGRW